MSERTQTVMEVSCTTPADDEALSQRVRRALQGIGPLCNLGSPLQIHVNNGVVTLSGVVASYRCEAEIARVVYDVPGVCQVHNKLWV